MGVGGNRRASRGATALCGVLAAVLGRIDDGYLIETPCCFQAAIAWGQPLTTVDVMLDPGHGDALRSVKIRGRFAPRLAQSDSCAASGLVQSKSVSSG